jgi:hypothetical protein
MAGYSGTPLAKKLGIKNGFRVWFANTPDDFDQDLDLPADLKINSTRSEPLDLIMLFTKSEAKLRKEFTALAKKLCPNGMIWVCWPKKASGVATDVNENLVRRIGLEVDRPPLRGDGGRALGRRLVFDRRLGGCSGELAAKPRLLLADEPTGNLDPNTSVDIMRLLDKVNRIGTTVVMATHDQAIVDAMRKRVVELEKGRVIRDQARGVYS